MRILLITLLFLIFVGCQTNPNKSVEKLNVKLPAQWQSQVEGSAIDMNAWLLGFKNKQLEGLVDEALNKNNDLQATAARVEAAQAVVRISGAGRLPQAGLRGGSSRAKRNFIGFSGLTGGSAGSVASSRSDTHALALDLSWEIDLWGRIKDVRSSAEEDLKASEMLYEGARLSLVAHVVESWYMSVASRKQLELSQSVLTSYEREEELIGERYEQGVSSALDLRLIRASSESAQAAVYSRQMQHEDSIRALEILLGRYPSVELKVVGDLDIDLPDVPVDLPSSLLDRRPDIVVADHKLEAAGFRVSEAKKAMLPAISLTGSGGTSSDKLKEVLNQDYSVWNIAGNILQPIFQGGKLKAGADRAEAQWKEKLFLYRTTVLRAYREVESYLTADSMLKQEEGSLSSAREEAEAAEQLAQERYESGVEGIMVLLESKRKHFNAQGELLNIKLKWLRNRINLYLALGGGFEKPKTVKGGEEI